MPQYDETQPDLNGLFAEIVRDAFESELGTSPEPDIEQYLGQLLVRFLHTDQIFALKNASGQRLLTISDMVAEGDIRLNADSFERERLVHRHIGDFLLFWSGLYPEFLRQLKVMYGADILCDYMRQGKESYHVVSTFDFPPHDREAPTFRKLSHDFEAYAFALRSVRQKLGSTGHA